VRMWLEERLGPTYEKTAAMLGDTFTWP